MFYWPNPDPFDYYMELFRGIEISDISRLVRSIIRIFKRRDRIVYVLKLYRFFHCLNKLQTDKPLADMLAQRIISPHLKRCSRIVKKYIYEIFDSKEEIQGFRIARRIHNEHEPGFYEEKSALLRGSLRDYQAIVRELEHFVITGERNNFYHLNSIVWERQPPYDLIGELRAVEHDEIQRREDKKRDISILEEDIPFIEFDDGYYWCLVGEENADLEARSMAHCGQGRLDSRLLSLRKPGKTPGTVRAVVTAEWFPKDYSWNFAERQVKKDPPSNIFSCWGVIGEMKGYANNKPKEKYHPYIIPLLRHHMVQQLVPAYYHPENNFKLTDLPKEVGLQLAAEKPQLYGTKALINALGEYEVYEFLLNCIDGLSPPEIIRGRPAVPVINSNVVMRDFGTDLNEAEDFVCNHVSDQRSYGFGSSSSTKDTCQFYVEILRGEKNIDDYYYSEYAETDQYLDKLKSEKPELYQQLVDEIADSNGVCTETAEYILETNPPDDVVSAAKIAETTAFQYGSEHAMWEAIQSLIRDIEFTSGAGFEITEDEEGANLYKLVIPLEKLWNFVFSSGLQDDLIDSDELFEECERGTASIQTNVDEWDQEAGFERFVEEIYEIIP